MTQPTNSIDSELEEILQDLFVKFFEGQIALAGKLTSGETSIEEALLGEETTTKYAQKALQAIKALYISRKEIEEALKDEAFIKPTTKRRTFKEIARYARQALKNELRAKLLPPTKGDK